MPDRKKIVAVYMELETMPKEGREDATRIGPLLEQAGVLDPAWYLVHYPDLAAAGVDALRHYVEHGLEEARVPAQWLDDARHARVIAKAAACAKPDQASTLLALLLDTLPEAKETAPEKTDVGDAEAVQKDTADGFPGQPASHRLILRQGAYGNLYDMPMKDSGKMAQKIKAVIFDMDGVLIDAKEWHYESLNRALGLFGYEISRYDHLSRYDGLPTLRKLKMLSKEHSLPVELHQFINDLKQKYTMEIIHTKCKPVFQHEYALSNLKRMGYKLVVASNSVRFSVEMMMKYSCLDKYLDVMLSNEDVSKPKPDPEIYLKAMGALALGPDECLIVEDNENGIAAARASGAHVMVVRNVRDVNLDNLMNHLQAGQA